MGKAAAAGPGSNAPVVDGFDCTSPSSCIAVTASGAVYSLHNGTAVRTDTLSSAGYSMAASCVSATTCVVLPHEEAEQFTSDGGQSWSRLPSRFNGLPTSVTCWRSGRCLLLTEMFGMPFGSWAYRSSNSGRTWTLQPLAKDQAGYFTCQTPWLCETLTEPSLGTFRWWLSLDGGKHWANHPIPGHPKRLYCFDGEHCLAIGRQVIRTSDGGQHWQISKLPDRGRLSSVHCFTAEHCLGVGTFGGRYRGAAFATSDGGTTWARQKLPLALGPLAALSCQGSAKCEIVANSVPGAAVLLTTTDGGRAWRTKTFAPAPAYHPFDCPFQRACLILAGWDAPNNLGGGQTVTHLERTLDGGKTWVLQPSRQSFATADFDCLSEQVCLAGTTRGIERTVDGGRTWSHTDAGWQETTSISCHGARYCYAVVTGTPCCNALIRSTDAGLRWKVLFEAPSRIKAVSCPGRDTCELAMSSSFYGTTDSGRKWTDTTLRPVGYQNRQYPEIYAISCPTRRWCMATAGASWERLGGGYGTERRILDLSPTGRLERVAVPKGGDISTGALSCPQVDVCQLSGGFYTIDGGRRWIKERLPKGTELAPVYCTKPLHCLAESWRGWPFVTVWRRN